MASLVRAFELALLFASHCPATGRSSSPPINLADLVRNSTAAGGSSAEPAAGSLAKDPSWQWMRNQGDVQYTSNVSIGGQIFEALLDTGSFEMLVFSQHCEVCGKSWSLYNDSQSSTYTQGKIHTDHGFGSGTTWSISAFDNVDIGPLTSKRQFFWEVYDADMPLLEQGSPFQLLIGVGPPKSAVKMAQEALDAVREEVSQRKIKGSSETEDLEVLDQYEKTAEIVRNTSSFVGKLGLNVYSFCFLKPSGWGGYFVLNDKDPEEETRAAMFTKIPVVGDLYWSAEMTDVTLGVGPGGEEKSALGCHGEPCSAVIDTGTSLILAPSDAVAKVDEALDKWLRVSGNCSDLSMFPDFEFKLAGQTFSLPPEAYIGEVDGEYPEDIAHMLQHWTKRMPSGVQCVPLMMVDDIPTQFGPLWILGMPFFRKYYSTFKLDNSADASMSASWVPNLVAKNMFFAEADDQCKPMRVDDATFYRSSLTSEKRKKNAMKVNATALRVPTWAKSARYGNHLKV